MSSIDTLINNTIRSDVRAVSGYHVADASGYIKLDAMENPYHLPEHLTRELGQRLADVVLNRYPDDSHAGVKQRIRAKLGIPAGYDVVLGNGSNELISMLGTACAHQDRRAVAISPTPSFVMYGRSTRVAGMDYVGIPLKADMSLDMPAMLAAIAQHKPALVFLSYPNNPTGNLFPVDDIVTIIRALDGFGLAVVDEAYEPFAQQTFMDRLPEFDNLVVMRTVSKLGLAGIRLGYMSAAPKLLEQLDKVRPPYNINVLTLAAAEFALDHLEVLDRQAAALRAARGDLMAALAAMPGVEVFPSAANFILIRVPNADDAYAKLLSHKVLIKNMSKMDTVMANCLRVTVSTPEENAAFLDALSASLAPLLA